MTAGRQILTYLIGGIILGFVIGFISREFGSGLGIVIVVVLGLAAMIAYLTLSEKQETTSYDHDDEHSDSSGVQKANLDVLNISEDTVLRGDDARKWLDDLMVKQQSK